MSDPSIHRQREVDFIRHVDRLLDDSGLRIDTTGGRRPVTGFSKDVKKADHAVDLQRLMSEMNKPDRELKSQMPIGETIDVTLSKRRLVLFKKVVGRLKVVTVSPTRSLIAGESAQPLTTPQIQKILGEIPPPSGGVPSTLVLMSTSGFAMDAHELADRRADRTVVLVEPNNAGGWTVYGPVETKSLVDLFDPEAEEAKRARVREEIDATKTELSGSGIASDKIAAKTQLPLQLVESELRSYAKAGAGLAAKRLDGRVVLFRQGSQATGQPAIGGNMPLIDKVKTLFARKGENEKKIAFLSERRTALSQQRDRSYEEMAAQERQEADLRKQFKDSTGEITKRRVTSQLLQLRKDIERRQQLLTVLNQQINVVSTHLHNLELVQQGQTAKLPDGEEMAADAARAEEMLAELEANTELAATVGGVATATMSQEEQALYEELEREGAPAAPAPSPVRESTPQAVKPISIASPQQPRKAEAEPG
jgi:hypothetical protein